MALTIEKLAPGMTVYDCHREKAGNTTMSVEGTWEVTIKEVHVGKGWSDGVFDASYVIASWNGNEARRYYPAQFSKWKLNPKEWSQSSLFGDRGCYLCRAKETQGHRPTCTHPRAEASRKNAGRL